VTLNFNKGPAKLNPGICAFLYAFQLYIELSACLGPVKPALLSMDDGSNNELPDDTQATSDPSKGD